MLQYFSPEYIKNRIVREYEEMSTLRKIVYLVLLIGAAVLTTLLLTHAWDPFAVQTGVTHIQQHKTPGQ